MEVAVFLNTRFTVVHYYHSGFSVEWKQMLFVFDYWRGENRELPEKEQLKGEDLKAFQQVEDAGLLSL